MLKPRARVTRSGNSEDWVDNQGIFTSTIMTLLKLSIVFMVNIYRFISKGGLTLLVNFARKGFIVLSFFRSLFK